MLALAWADEDGRPIDPSNAIYLSFNPPQLLASSTIKEMCAGMRTMHQAFRHAPSVSFDEPTSAADLVRCRDLFTLARALITLQLTLRSASLLPTLVGLYKPSKKQDISPTPRRRMR